MDYFIYDGVDSRDFGLYIVNDGRQKNNMSPPKISYSLDIPSINGKLLSEQKYGIREIPLRLYLKDNSASNQKIVMAWLGQLGEKELILSYESYKIYTGTFEDSVEIENYMNGGIFNLRFKLYSPMAKSRIRTGSGVVLNYNDEHLYNSGLLYGFSTEDYTFANITTATEVEVYHGGNLDGALPVITVNGSVDSITITQYKTSERNTIHRQLSYGSFSGELIIDGEVKNTFLNGSLNNLTFDGRYLELFGKTDWDFLSKGDVQSTTTNTIILSQNDSEVDDIYNGKVVFLRDRDNEIQYYKILDYDGATKTLTIEGDVSEVTNDWSYSIYDVANGINYITIDGTNLNITDIVFDFNYIYL